MNVRRVDSAREAAEFGQLLPLLQLVDSAFPTGAFSHSFGLETVLQERWIRDPAGLQSWIANYIRGSLAPIDGVGVYWAWHDAFPTCKERRVVDLDHHLTVIRLARESRDGGIKVAKRYLHTVLELYPDSGLQMYREWIQAGVCYGSVPIVHGWICAHMEHSAHAAVASHLYAAVNSLVQNALRAMSMGQTDGQRVLRSLLTVMSAEARRIVVAPPPLEEIGGYTLHQEIAAMRHESLYSRLFMS